MILILNNIYLGDLILKSLTYDDFAHLCLSLVLQEAGWGWIATSSITGCPTEAHVAVAQTGGEALDARVSPLV